IRYVRLARVPRLFDTYVRKRQVRKFQRERTARVPLIRRPRGALTAGLLDAPPAIMPYQSASMCYGKGFKPGCEEKRQKSKRSIDATTYSMLISLFTLCVAPSAGLVMTRSSIPVNRGIVRAFGAAANV